MNGAEETKGFILKTVAEKVAFMEQNGCALGRVQDQRLSSLEHCMDGTSQSVKEIIRTLDQKMNWIIGAGIILSFLAGVNTFGDIIKLMMGVK